MSVINFTRLDVTTAVVKESFVFVAGLLVTFLKIKGFFFMFCLLVLISNETIVSLLLQKLCISLLFRCTSLQSYFVVRVTFSCMMFALFIVSSDCMFA